MSALGRVGLACRLLRSTRSSLKRNISQSANLQAPEWNVDWKPGPYPKTPEARAEAAKKYGMRVEDYEPYPDDGTGWGDYPKLPPYGPAARSGNENWDMPIEKRNFGEPVHIDIDAYAEARVDPMSNPRYSYVSMGVSLAAFLGSLFLLYSWTSEHPHHLPLMPKQYPYNELYLDRGGDPANEPTIKHYTFEPAAE